MATDLQLAAKLFVDHNIVFNEPIIDAEKKENRRFSMIERNERGFTTERNDVSRF